MLRYQKYNYLLKYLQISKFNLYNTNFISLQSINVHAGHFKLNQFFSEYGLLLYSLTNQFPKIKIFKHGKKLKNTILITSNISSYNKWLVLDKIIYELLPAVNDLSLISQKQNYNFKNTYNFRLRNYFELEEIDSFITDRILKRDIFLPLFFEIALCNNNNKINNENYLRMLRLPFYFNKNKKFNRI